MNQSIILNRDNYEKIDIKNVLFGKNEGAKTSAYIKVCDRGISILFKVLEENPKAIYGRDMDPVYKDSAVEAFLMFFGEKNKGCYFNFELNSKACVLAGFGKDRERRGELSSTDIASIKAEKMKDESSWGVKFIVSNELIEKYYGKFQRNNFRANFYKISESPEIEHYMSASNIESNEINFHKPEFFMQVKIR